MHIYINNLIYPELGLSEALTLIRDVLYNQIINIIKKNIKYINKLKKFNKKFKIKIKKIKYNKNNK